MHHKLIASRLMHNQKIANRKVNRHRLGDGGDSNVSDEESNLLTEAIDHAPLCLGLAQIISLELGSDPISSSECLHAEAVNKKIEKKVTTSEPKQTQQLPSIVSRDSTAENSPIIHSNRRLPADWQQQLQPSIQMEQILQLQRSMHGPFTHQRGDVDQQSAVMTYMEALEALGMTQVQVTRPEVTVSQRAIIPEHSTTPPKRTREAQDEKEVAKKQKRKSTEEIQPKNGRQIGGEGDDDDDSCKGQRFRAYQFEQWTEKFRELCDFRKAKGHCQVPHTFIENPPLARWVKRQRYQYKLRAEGKQSTMTDERVELLGNIGFIWDSHAAAWEEKLNELKEYAKDTGDCNVPSTHPENPQLATWVKCQRRQYKLLRENKTSNMTLERMVALEKIGFVWELRKKFEHC